jgi:YD repeat-containing protein
MASCERMRILSGCLLLLAALTAVSPAAAETQTYNYDVFGRLIQTSTSNSTTSSMVAATTYDNADNRSNYTVTGSNNNSPVVGAIVVPLRGFTIVPIMSNAQ